VYGRFPCNLPYMTLLKRKRPGMRLLRKALPWAAGFVVLWLAICAVAGVIAVEGALHPARLSLTPADESAASALATTDHGVLEDVSATAKDGAVLRAWYIRATPGNDDSVILLHGQADNRAGMLGAADLLLRHGYSVLLPDARAHGMSGGAIATYGLKEAGISTIGSSGWHKPSPRTASMVPAIPWALRKFSNP